MQKYQEFPFGTDICYMLNVIGIRIIITHVNNFSLNWILITQHLILNYSANTNSHYR